MAKHNAFGNEEEDFDLEDLANNEYDASEDAIPIVHTVIKRLVEQPVRVVIEATVGEESTFIKYYRAGNPDKFVFCFVDTLDPEMILNTLEMKLNDGLLEEVEDFFKQYGRSISDPVKFRLKLDAVVKVAGPDYVVL